jgi:transcriptional regulator with XRE-family HTH domain
MERHVQDLLMVHHVHMAKKQVVTRFKTPRFRPTFIRQWREHRGMTLEQLGEAIDLSHAQLGRIERGVQPYSQGLLEAIADVLATDAASLIVRNPADPEAIWSIWDQAKSADRQKIVAIAKTIVGKTGTER